MMRAIITAALAVAAVATAVAGEAERAADRFADTASRVEGLDCAAKHGSQTIVCLVRTDDRGTEHVAASLIMQARALDLPLQGWVLMLANPNDYVVSRNF